MTPRSKGFLVGLSLTGICVIAVLLIGADRSDRDLDGGPTLATVEREDFELHVRAVGELEPLRSTLVSSQVRGDRGKLIELIEDGAEVKEGDVLARLDPTPFEEDKLKAELEVAQAESLVEAHRQILDWEKAQAERQIKTAEFDLEAAALELQKLEQGEGPLELARREQEVAEALEEWEEQKGYLKELEALLPQGYVNASEIEQIRKKAEKARRSMEIAQRQHEAYRDFILPMLLAQRRAEVERAEMLLEQVKVSAGYKIGEAQAALQKAERELETGRARLQEALGELERTVIRAPIPGMVVHREEFRGSEKRKPRVGDTLWQNQPLLYLPDLSRMKVTTRVREVDLHKVSPGKPARVRVDAYPETVLEAQVRSIGILAEHRAGIRGGEKSFKLDVVLDGEDPRLRPGMTARVEILSMRIEDALTVPVHAIWEEGDRTFCYVARGSGFERRELRRGVRNEHRAVVEGLEEGERVSLLLPDRGKILSETLLSTGARSPGTNR